jgi:hypothetical protein
MLLYIYSGLTSCQLKHHQAIHSILCCAYNHSYLCDFYKNKAAEELEEEKRRQALIKRKKARDAAIEAEEKRKMLEEMAKNMPAPRTKKVKAQLGFQGRLWGKNGTPPTSDSESEDENQPEDVSMDPDTVMNTVLPPLIQQFNDEVVVSEGCFKVDGSIDVVRLERDLTLGKAVAGLRMANHLSKYMAPGEKLVRDPRFQEVKQSLGWTVLVVAGGLVKDVNVYNNPKKWSSFCVLFQQFMEEGENMDSDERKSLDEMMKELREFCVQKTSILFSTENNAASGFYWMNFPVIGDEYNRSLINDLIIIIAHYEPLTFLFFGDTKQLKPVVIGPTPLTGFLHEIEVSSMGYFLDAGWPSVEIYIQRRSRAGIMDIPSLCWYYAKAVNGPDAFSDIVHPHTKKVMDLVDKMFYDKDVQRSPAMYFEVDGSRAIVDPLTKSRYNLKHALLVMNVVEQFVKNNIPP